MGERKSEVYTHSDISKKKCENKMEVDFFTAKSNFEEGMRFFGISAYYFCKTKSEEENERYFQKSESVK